MCIQWGENRVLGAAAARRGAAAPRGERRERGWRREAVAQMRGAFKQEHAKKILSGQVRTVCVQSAPTGPRRRPGRRRRAPAPSRRGGAGRPEPRPACGRAPHRPAPAAGDGAATTGTWRQFNSPPQLAQATEKGQSDQIKQKYINGNVIAPPKFTLIFSRQSYVWQSGMQHAGLKKKFMAGKIKL